MPAPGSPGTTLLAPVMVIRSHLVRPGRTLQLLGRVGRCGGRGDAARRGADPQLVRDGPAEAVVEQLDADAGRQVERRGRR